MKLLITGATGNVGHELIRSLSTATIDNIKIYAGVRNIKSAKKIIDQNNIDYCYFDFGDQRSFSSALNNIDVLFLLRPPQIANVKKYFTPLIDCAVNKKVKHIIFLSVQGAEKIKFIPHYKIENLIINSNIDYTFIRPSYFMQNLSTTLKEDIENGLIYLPAKDAYFNYIDIKDIADFCVKIIANASNYTKMAFTLTGKKNYTFNEIKNLINKNSDRQINYKSPNPIVFILRQLSKGKSFTQSLVVLMLHFLQRFQKPPQISNDFEKVMNKSTRNLEDFIRRMYK